MSMIVDCAAYAAGRRVGQVAIDDLRATLRESDVFVWVGLHEPDERLMKKVQEQLDLHDLAVEDAHRAHQRPKIEGFGDSLFVVLHTAQLLHGEVHFGETHVFVGPRYLVTVRHGPSLSYGQVRARCESTPELLAQGPGFGLYAIMDFVVDNYFPMVEALEDELEGLEGRMFKGVPSAETVEHSYDIKRQVMSLRRVTVPLVDICSQLVRSPNLALIPDVTRPYFRDVQDHLLRMNEVIEAVREMVTTAINVNVSLISMRQNEIVKKLAGWAAIVAVPTMVASFYGMNFDYMPELNWRYGYPGVLATLAVACVVLYRKLRRAGWL